MNSLRWTAIIVWGLFLTALGLISAAPSADMGMGSEPSNVVFLIAGGLVTSLVGAIGLMGFMGWIPGLRSEQKSYL